MKTLLSALLLLAPAAALADEPAKVVVVPFAPLGGDVPNNAGAKAADVLATTLKSHDGLAVKLAGAGEADDPAAHLKKAQALSADARKDLDAGQPFAAKVKLQQVLEELAAGAAAMDDAEPLADAHAALSRALYQSGDDAAGQLELQRAEALHPNKDFAETRTSPLFAALAKDAESKVLGAEKAKLKIGSIPPGASAKIDGLDAGRTPVLVRELPPGAHLWRVDLPSGGSVGGVVEVKAGATAEVTGAALAKGPASPLVAQLAANALTQASVASMKDAAAGLDAQWLVFGGLHVEGSDLVLDSFVYAPKANGFARLPKVKFDPDLLTAGQELAKVAGDVAGRAGSATLGAAAKVPLKVSDTASAELVDTSEFRFPAAGTDEAQPKKDNGPRRVVGARKGPVTKQQ
ncbi:MAG: PEGA domain-containing protein [Deltaproteobacteria bacterium]|nr:PEGA domain-containing protein [Deltaproteobacteria bacterium]